MEPRAAGGRRAVGASSGRRGPALGRHARREGRGGAAKTATALVEVLDELVMHKLLKESGLTEPGQAGTGVAAAWRCEV